jgi:hypothetical protein
MAIRLVRRERQVFDVDRDYLSCSRTRGLENLMCLNGRIRHYQQPEENRK